MKKITALLLVAIIVVSLAACGKSNRYTSSDLSQDGEPTDFSAYVTPVQTPAPTSTPAPVITPEPTPVAPTPTPRPTSTTAPTAAIQNNGVLTITKSPTSETVDVGGSASFLAYANNFTSINWIVANPDSTTIIDANNAPSYFPGLGVNGQGTSLVKFSNIPAEMNGWKVQAVFNGNGGPKYTNVAFIYVTVVDADEAASKAYAQTVRSEIATLASGQGFATTDFVKYSYYSKLSDFELIFSKGSWSVYAEFISDVNAGTYYPLYATVYYNNSIAEGYNLQDQTMSSFLALLASLS